MIIDLLIRSLLVQSNVSVLLFIISRSLVVVGFVVCVMSAIVRHCFMAMRTMSFVGPSEE